MMRRPTFLRTGLLVLLGTLALALGGIGMTQVGLASRVGSPPTPPPPPPVAVAAPHIEPFANHLTGQVLGPAPPSPAASDGENIDGCDHAYGTAGQCIPYNFPPGVTDKCQWLRDHDFGPIEVPGVDSQHLAPAHGPRAPDGLPLACPDKLSAATGPTN